MVTSLALVMCVAVYPTRYRNEYYTVQVVVLEAVSDAVFWPSGTSPPRFVQNSINLVDCQGGVLDVRILTFDQTLEHATLILYRCLVIYPDAKSSWVSTQYFYDSTGIFLSLIHI